MLKYKVLKHLVKRNHSASNFSGIQTFLFAFTVSNNRPDVRTCDLGAPFVSLSLLYAILIWAASFILFHTVHIILLC